MKQGAAGDTVPPGEPAPFQPPGIAEVARLFPQLEIIAFIGKGGMGAVYKARQPALDRLVALKILPPQTAAGPGFAERFNREARALARLNHPNIVAVHEFGQVNGLSYFVMEFVDGLNLRELERAGKLSPREALQIVPQICEALQFAHDEGIVHRDIKPENILLDKKGRVKIADFGIAKILSGAPEADLTKTQGIIGTPNYMAPEQMEKPTSVDHRADIFSLGVVFYEMLTGELPLGKFAPPSSRKVEVDVRLDDVVLRTLEKDPERRYQHASQVKSAVDTIVGSAPPPPQPDAGTIAREILANDYRLNIRSCVRRGWKLLKGQFWPFVGITALFLALFSFASGFGGASIAQKTGPESGMEVSSGVGILVLGPLWGGLLCYFLKKIRMEPATVETAFCGFSHRFLHLFLAGFVTSVLTWLGFLCLVLPGIYLSIAWMFTLPIVVDKQVDFWTAMELSRKVVTKHWFKLFGFALVLWLLLFAGVLAFVVGVFVMIPLILGTLMYAYEDIFGSVKVAPAAPVATGPTGTIVVPPPVAQPSPSGAGLWNLATKIGVIAVAVVIGLFLLILVARHHVSHRWEQSPEAVVEPPMSQAAVEAVPPQAEEHPVEAIAESFGPVIERELQTGLNGTNQFLNLATQQVLTPPPEVAGTLTAADGRAWEALDISPDSEPYKYIKWLGESGADLMFADDGKIAGFDGVFAMAHGDTSKNWDDWDALTPEKVHAAVDSVEWERRAIEASAHHQPVPPAPATGGSYGSAMQLDSREPDGPTVNLLTRDQSVNWYFKTREGRMGVLQLASFSNSPAVAKIRYKLVESTGDKDTANARIASNDTRELLSARLEAASNISTSGEKDSALSNIAMAAADAGELEIARKAITQISNPSDRDTARSEAATRLAAHGMRRGAIDLAKGINNPSARNDALSQLAQ